MDGSVEVLGGFVDAWQLLGGADPADDLAVAAQETAATAIREELNLITNAENLIVLAGLGASLGIENEKNPKQSAPRMSDLWSLVVKLPSFDTVRSELNPDLVAKENLEHVLSDAQARLALDPAKSDLARFVMEAEDVVWESCNFIDHDSRLETHELFLRKVGRRSTRLQRTQIFTTNYDLAIEFAARRTRFNVVDGFGYGGQEFDGASFDLDFVRRRPHEPLALEPNVFHLLKLHGSVDWDAAHGTVRKHAGDTKPASPVLIYPSAAKYQLSYQQPYLEFMSRFQIALRQPDVGLIVVGFGFNDEHLVAPIEAALRSNIGLRAIVVTPGARDPERSESLAWIENLIERGDRRLTLLNGTFDDLVKYLPDVPAREERDAHAERVSRTSGKH
ncbi:SIR2 family protein [Rhodococcus sp. AH-ZY2]|uniref:SIR2 family protein n=1 Tax=Rhodococcus sp. AH-ZY2 TaxID=3047468 RepID=UPI0027E20210|nr:SIR2 family protein [Rhodococcus sp. AH-ZY2]WML66160.1 SIR2 family protein [Rhodococcus sp. AH-ZY2]